MPDTQESKDKQVETVEGQKVVKLSSDGRNEDQENKAATVLLEAENGEEEKRVREAMKKRFVLLAEDNPELGVKLEKEIKEAGAEEMVWAEYLDKVKEGVDNFISKVERGELDQTILTMIADLEYPYEKYGLGSPDVGVKGIKYVRDAVAKHNLAHSDKPLQVEVILNSTSRYEGPVDAIEAISPDKKEAVKKLLEMIRTEK